jgi:hypothetical protein
MGVDFDLINSWLTIISVSSFLITVSEIVTFIYMGASYTFWKLPLDISERFYTIGLIIMLVLLLKNIIQLTGFVFKT